MSWCRWQDDTLYLQVRLQPRASRDEVLGVYGDRLRLRVTAPPVEGAANVGLAELLARELGVAKSQVEILSGQASRDKRVAVRSPRRCPDWLAPAGGGRWAAGP